VASNWDAASVSNPAANGTPEKCLTFVSLYQVSEAVMSRQSIGSNPARTKRYC
jgi:hypothetical protein